MDKDDNYRQYFDDDPEINNVESNSFLSDETKPTKQTSN